MHGAVAVAFTPAPAKHSPNVRSKDDSGALAAYYRAMVLTFASVRRWNPEEELALVTDQPALQPFAAQLDDLGVRVIYRGFDHRPPEGFYSTFNASLYTLDVLDEFARSHPDDKKVLLIDPDVLCTDSLSAAFEAVSDQALLVYATGFPPDEVSQGVSALDAVSIHRELNPTLMDPPVHYGGEFYGFTCGALRPVLERAEAAFDASLERWKSGRKPYLVTEEHMLNYALRGATLTSASPFVRRIWTAPRYRTVWGDERTLALWHLPSEKDRGFPPLHAAAMDQSSWFWQAPHAEWLRRVGRELGIPRRTPSRWAYDAAGRTIRTLQDWRRLR